MANFSLDPSYIDVAARIVEFRGKFPDGSLQQVKYELLEVGGKTFITYTAAAYRTPDDIRPGIGTAWEPVPGPTQFTRDSEMQNAETAAWGRAIVAVLAADTKRGIASAEEVRNRQPEQRQQSDRQQHVRPVLEDPLSQAKQRAAAALRKLHPTWDGPRQKAEAVDALAAINLTTETATIADWDGLAAMWSEEAVA